MLKINCLALPESLPIPEAMKPGNKNDYDPIFWEFLYEIFRYLECATDNYVIARYNGILKNMAALTSPDRDVIPVCSFLSSWYWFRKEHQTRYEIQQRGLELPQKPPVKLEHSTNYDAPYCPRSPNSGDILFRYTNRQFAEEMLEKGKIRIGAASLVERLDSDMARFDKELEKSSYLPGMHVHVETEDGRKLPIIGDFCRTVSFPDYYFLCMSLDWDSALFNDFSADCCVVIKEPDIFRERLEKVTERELAGWEFHDLPVEYYDPYERIRNQLFSAGISKDFCYAYQRENRFIWFHPQGIPAQDYKFLSLGSLADIAEIHTL
jgi:hypothetical protein